MHFQTKFLYRFDKNGRLCLHRLGLCTKGNSNNLELPHSSVNSQCYFFRYLSLKLVLYRLFRAPPTTLPYPKSHSRAYTYPVLLDLLKRILWLSPLLPLHNHFYFIISSKHDCNGYTIFHCSLCIPQK